MKQIRFINRYLGQYRSYLFFVLLIVVIYSFLNLCTPLIFSFVIDNVIDLQPIDNGVFQWFVDVVGGIEVIRSNLWIGGAMVLTVSFVICICMFIRGYGTGKISESLAYELRNELYEHIQHLPYKYHKGVKTGDLIQRCTSDVETIRRFIGAQLSEMLYSICTATIASIVLFQIDARMAWIAIMMMPILVFFAYRFFTKAQKLFLASDESEGDMTALIQENLSGIRVIKAFNSERVELHKFEEKSKDFRDKTFLLIKQLGIYWGASDFFCLLQILLVVVFSVLSVRSGEFSVGNFFVFVSYEAMILWPVRNLGRMLADMGKMNVSIGRLQEILDEPREDFESGSLDEIHGDIEFSHVGFKYDDGTENALYDLNFKINKGQTVALLGPTGSGKSSLVNLLTRLYDTSEGEILIDGKPINGFQRSHLRENIGLILQEPFLFSKTIYDNIQLANHKAEREDVVRVAKIASVHDVIEDFDRGYDTIVGERGVTLSGGQKQRVAIARTILKDTPILIFDDSLSAVDTQTDAEIRSRLREVQHDRTTFIITQRVSSAKDADLILVLEHGVITQRGTHDELLQQDGLYQRIHTIQTDKMEVSDHE